MVKHRYRLRYSLRALMIATMLLACGLAVVANRVATQRRVVDEIGEYGYVIYHHELKPHAGGGHMVEYGAAPDWPAWMQSLLGADYFRSVHRVDFRPTDELVQELALLTDVEAVTLDARDLSDAGLAPLAHMPNLKQISIRNGQWLTNESFARLAEVRGLNRLLVRNLPIGDAALLHLKQLDELRQFDLANTYVTPEGVEKLESILPLASVRIRGDYVVTERDRFRLPFKRNDEVRGKAAVRAAEKSFSATKAWPKGPPRGKSPNSDAELDRH